MDVLREIGAEIEGFTSMLEASLIAGQLADLRINEGDSSFAISEKFTREGGRICSTPLWCHYCCQSLGVCGRVPHQNETHQ